MFASDTQGFSLKFSSIGKATIGLPGVEHLKIPNIQLIKSSPSQ